MWFQASAVLRGTTSQVTVPAAGDARTTPTPASVTAPARTRTGPRTSTATSSSRSPASARPDMKSGRGFVDRNVSFRKSLAEGVGFEPTDVSVGRFQGACTRPLCEPSSGRRHRCRRLHAASSHPGRGSRPAGRGRRVIWRRTAGSLSGASGEADQEAARGRHTASPACDTTAPVLADHTRRPCRPRGSLAFRWLCRRSAGPDSGCSPPRRAGPASRAGERRRRRPSQPHEVPHVAAHGHRRPAPHRRPPRRRGAAARQAGDLRLPARPGVLRRRGHRPDPARRRHRADPAAADPPDQRRPVHVRDRLDHPVGRVLEGRRAAAAAAGGHVHRRLAR